MISTRIIYKLFIQFLLPYNQRTFKFGKCTKYLSSLISVTQFFLKYNSYNFEQQAISFKVEILFTDNDNTSKFGNYLNAFKSSMSFPHKFKFLI